MQRTLQRESLVLTRVYQVAPDKVWRAWVEADALRVWFGQAVSPVWEAELDVRTGGCYRFVMLDREGTRYDVNGVYREVAEPRRLVFTWVQRGGPFEGEALITVELSPVRGGTELRFTLDPVFDPRAQDAWSADFSRLGRFLRAG
jgi:uncharacterized protein YndB with AHSA1/START domain